MCESWLSQRKVSNSRKLKKIMKFFKYIESVLISNLISTVCTNIRCFYFITRKRKKKEKFYREELYLLTWNVFNI